MGVAVVDFPQGPEFYNFFSVFSTPSRRHSNTKSFVRNYFTDEPYYDLTNKS